MKLVVAIIKPYRLDAVKDALGEIGVQGLTVTDVRGVGRQKGHSEVYRGTEYQIDLIPKIRLELAIPADQLAKVLETIERTARTGKIGDGKIFVMGLDEVVRIRTGERGTGAL